jgi:hypothetical protein
MATAGTGLRNASHLRRDNKTGFEGVRYVAKSGKYEAFCKLNGTRHYLGMYEDVLDAGCAASDFRLQHAAEREAIQKDVARRRSAKSKAMWDALTPEQKAERIRNATNKLTPEERKAVGQKAADTRLAKYTKAELHETYSNGQLKRTAAARRRSALKGQATRRARATA